MTNLAEYGILKDVEDGNHYFFTEQEYDVAEKLTREGYLAHNEEAQMRGFGGKAYNLTEKGREEIAIREEDRFAEEERMRSR